MGQEFGICALRLSTRSATTAMQSGTKNYQYCDSTDIFLRKSQPVAFRILHATEDQREEKLKKVWEFLGFFKGTTELK